MIALGDLIEDLGRRGVGITAAGRNLHYRAPKGAMTAELRAALVANKAALLDLLTADRPDPESLGPPPIAERCFACDSTDFWERPAENGGGRVCSVCHPDPRRLAAEWRSHSKGLTTVSFEGRRRHLFSWAMEHGCPELNFRPWAKVAGRHAAWLVFLQTASDEDVDAALEAAGAEVAH